jgi:hypothetical protein
LEKVKNLAKIVSSSLQYVVNFSTKLDYSSTRHGLILVRYAVSIYVVALMDGPLGDASDF